MAVDEAEAPAASHARAKKKRSPLQRALRQVLGLRPVQIAIGTTAAGYIRLVGATNRRIYEGAFDYAAMDVTAPVIMTMWHGQHFLLPLLRRRDHPVVALASRHRDGGINAIAARRFGIATVRGSAAREPGRIMESGGVSGFLKLRAALKRGTSVTLTADLSRGVSRHAGIGIIRLARASGVPIMPVAVATSRRVEVRSWDHAAVNLPFGRMAVIVGEMVHVPADADDDAMESARRQLEEELNRVTGRAYAIVDRRRG